MLMYRVIASYVNWISKLNIVLGKTIVYILPAVMILGTYEVLARYFFGWPTKWVWEESGLLICAAVALTAGYVLVKEAHVKVDIIYGRFSPRGRAIIDLCTSVFAFFYLGTLLWKGVEVSVASVQVGERSFSLWGPIIYPYKVALAAGILLFLMQVLAKFFSDLLIVIHKTPIRDPNEH